MNLIDMTVIVALHRRVHRTRGLAGLAVTRVEGLFPRREQHSRLGGDDLDRRDGDEHVTFLSVPGVAYRGDFAFLQLAFGYILGRVVVATVLLPAYFRGRDLHRLSIAAGSVRRADADDGLDPLPDGPLARRRPPALPGGDGA